MRRRAAASRPFPGSGRNTVSRIAGATIVLKKAPPRVAAENGGTAAVSGSDAISSLCPGTARPGARTV